MWIPRCWSPIRYPHPPTLSALSAVQPPGLALVLTRGSLSEVRSTRAVVGSRPLGTPDAGAAAELAQQASSRTRQGDAIHPPHWFSDARRRVVVLHKPELCSLSHTVYKHQASSTLMVVGHQYMALHYVCVRRTTSTHPWEAGPAPPAGGR
jgi:hypothetical protein